MFSTFFYQMEKKYNTVIIDEQKISLQLEDFSYEGALHPL